jgi:hypothetical protein
MDGTPQEPTPQEAEDALREIRSQQAELVRTPSLAPWWYPPFFVAWGTAFGFARDVQPNLVLPLAAGLFVIIFVARRRATMRLSNSWVRRQYDRRLWLAVVGYLVAIALLAFVAPWGLATLGVPMPNTICWFVLTVVLVLSSRPLNRWFVSHLARRVESGTQ